MDDVITTLKKYRDELKKEMDEDKISRAREEMEEILNELEVAPEEGFSGYCLLPKDHPKLIGRGDLALVLGLSNGIVGKIVRYEDVTEPQNNYSLMGHYVGQAPHDIETTVKALRRMGFDNVLDHVEIERHPSVQPHFYHLSPDLRGDGRYEVYSVEDFPFDNVENGQELRTQMDTSLTRMVSETDSKNFYYTIDRHDTKDGPHLAFQKMFIGRIDKQTNQGGLFFADLDHCVIYRDTLLSKEYYLI